MIKIKNVLTITAVAAGLMLGCGGGTQQTNTPEGDNTPSGDDSNGGNVASQAASDAPRWHVGPNFDLLLEEGTTSSTYRGLIDRGHSPTISKDSNIFGGAQLIY